MSEVYLDSRRMRLSDGEVDATIIDIEAVPENTFFKVGDDYATAEGMRVLFPHPRAKCDCMEGPRTACVRMYNKAGVLEIVRENRCTACGGHAG